MIYKKLILLSLFFSVTILGQTSPHIISGIDLNKDWYNLTNQSALSYYSQEIYRKDKNLDGVTMNISDDYMTSLVDDDFLKIGFTNIALNFPFGGQTKLNTLKPTILIANVIYNSKKDFEEYNSKDFNKIVYILMNQFGAPNSTIKKDWGAQFLWEFSNAQLVLNSNKTDHITLMYLKND